MGQELAALLVHDLKGPLSAIAMNVEMLRGELGEDGVSPDAVDDFRVCLDDCRSSSQRLFRMIANLLDVARAEQGKLAAARRAIDAGAIVRGILREHASEAEQRRLEVTLDALDGDASPRAVADPDLVARVVENLIDNAIRFAKNGGRVFIRVASLPDGGFELAVANDGARIPPEQRARVFDKYVRYASHEERALHRGLGLYFCRLAVEAHGGSIALVDVPSFGACFRAVFGGGDPDELA